MNPTVSIIIPVYNAEKTLRRCVESIVYGKLQDMEVILVEDHSKDDSWQLCCALAKENTCVRAVQNPKNCGVSYTRNHGLQEAQGEYALFVDSDDWVSGDFASTLLQTGLEYPECLAVCGFEFIDHTTNSRHSYLYSAKESLSIVERYNFFELVDAIQIQNVWNKLFRMDLIRQHSVQFDESIRMGEDFQFVLDYLEKGSIESCAVINQPLYYYIRYNNQSLMSGFAKDPIANGEKRIRQLAAICGVPSLAEHEISKLRNNYTYHIVRNKAMSRKEKRSILDELWPDGSSKKQLRTQQVLACKEALVRLKSAPGRFLRRIRGRLQREFQARKIAGIRSQLKQTDFTILSQNCIGGVFYHDMRLEFASPTINLYFDAPDFLRFTGNLEHCLAQDLQMRWDKEYPIGLLGDVTIYFMHYDSCTEARDAWLRRAKRIRKDRIVVLSTDRNGFGPEEYEEWKKIPYKKLLYTAHSEYRDDSIYFPEYADLDSVPDLLNGKKFYKSNRLVKLLNSL